MPKAIKVLLQAFIVICCWALWVVVPLSYMFEIGSPERYWSNVGFAFFWILGSFYVSWCFYNLMKTYE